ncbi:MAG TPA: DUF5666 domain-containing protein [Terriglobales bacterium]|jgi:hypothetical protein|nr:DUF5666 domain-containing protein [Terriglobales bacterium]
MKRAFLFVLISLMFVYLSGCGGSGNGPVQMTGTPMTLQTGDAVNDHIAKFELTISSIILTGASGTTDTANLLSGPAEVEFSHQAGAFEPLTLAHVPPGTYNGASVMVSNPEVVAIVGGVATKLTPTLSSTTVNVSFSPNVTVGTSPMFLNFDLDLANSVTINGTSATIAPKFNVSTSTVAPNQNNENDDDGEIEDVHGSVTSIAAPNFTIQTRTGPITFATDSTTRFQDGIAQLSDLKMGDIVEVAGITKSDGTKLATKVEREGDRNGVEVEGLISALDSPLSKITIVHQMDSTGSSNSPVTVDVSVNSSTVFSTRFDKLNITNAPIFDATHIGKGQRIEADASSSSAPLIASKVKLREQALVGTVAASPAPTSAGFTLNISSTSAFGTLSGATSVPVILANGATLETTPSAGASIRVRGLVFFNGTTYTMVAVRGDDNH